MMFQNLPPKTMDSFDMSRIVHEMTSVKSQLQILQEAQETILNAHAALCEKSQVVERNLEFTAKYPTVSATKEAEW